jgi:predicted RNase H-like nuclease (RuvC/YqgF family)
MRFSLTMEDSLVEQIDEEARQTGTTRAEWIRTACTDALTTEAPEEHRPDPPELIELRVRTDYQEKTIRDLEKDREYLRSEVARLVQENSLLMHRLLPAPKTGAISRFRRWLSGNGEE